MAVSLRKSSIAFGAAASMLLAAAPSASSAVLYDQTTGTAGGVVSSAGTAVDDFVVPPGPSWVITSIDVRGSGGHAGSAYLFESFRDAGGLPGASDYIRSPLTPGSSDNFTLNFGGYPYSPGRHWVSVSANRYVTDPGPFWAWRTQAPQSGLEAVWRGAGCSTFQPVSACGQPGPDLQFRLTGRVVSSEFQLGEPKRSPNGGVDIQGLFPNPGVVEFEGRGMKPKEKEVGKNRSGVAPDYVYKQNISLTPTASVKKKLTAGKRKRTTAVITYTPYAGSEFATEPRTLNVKLLLKRPGHGASKKN